MNCQKFTAVYPMNVISEPCHMLLQQVAGDAEEGGGGSIRRAIERE